MLVGSVFFMVFVDNKKKAENHRTFFVIPLLDPQINVSELRHISFCGKECGESLTLIHYFIFFYLKTLHFKQEASCVLTLAYIC